MNLNATLLGEMITFGIFVWFTMRFVIPPIQDIVQERQELAQETEANHIASLKESEAAKSKAKKIEQDAAKSAKDQMISAKEQAKDIIAVATSDAKEKANKIKSDAEKEAKQQYELVMQELKNNFATSIIISGVEAVLKTNATTEMNLEIVDKVIAEEV